MKFALKVLFTMIMAVVAMTMAAPTIVAWSSPAANRAQPLWHAVAALPLQPTALSCAAHARCVIVGETSGVAAIDYESGAGTFLPASVPNGVINFLSISCTAATCVAVGTGGPAGTAALYSRDSGHSWTMGLITDSPGGTGYSVSCPTSANCFMTAAGGTILESTDAGATWSVTGFDPGDPGNPSPLVVACPSRTACAAAGWWTSGSAAGATEAAYTSDAGTSWYASSTPDTGIAASVGCTTSGSLCTAVACAAPVPAACTSGAILSSTDAGTSYVDAEAIPNPSAAAACGTAACVVIGPSTDLVTTDGRGFHELGVSGGVEALLPVGSCVASQCYGAGAGARGAVLLEVTLPAVRHGIATAGR